MGGFLFRGRGNPQPGGLCRFPRRVPPVACWPAVLRHPLRHTVCRRPELFCPPFNSPPNSARRAVHSRPVVVAAARARHDSGPSGGVACRGVGGRGTLAGGVARGIAPPVAALRCSPCRLARGLISAGPRLAAAGAFPLLSYLLSVRRRLASLAGSRPRRAGSCPLGCRVALAAGSLAVRGSLPRLALARGGPAGWGGFRPPTPVGLVFFPFRLRRFFSFFVRICNYFCRPKALSIRCLSPVLDYPYATISKICWTFLFYLPIYAISRQRIGLWWRPTRALPVASGRFA